MTCSELTSVRGPRELLALAAAGDRDAFGRLYDLTVDDVWRTVRGAGAPPALAERVVAAAYVDLWTCAREVAQDLEPRLWLMGRVYVAVRGAQQAA